MGWWCIMSINNLMLSFVFRLSLISSVKVLLVLSLFFFTASHALSYTHPGVSVLFKAFKIESSLNEQLPILLPITDSVIVPTDKLLYQIRLKNDNDYTLKSLVLNSELTESLELDPESITGPNGLHVEWTSNEKKEFLPLFVLNNKGEYILNADLDLIRYLRFTLDTLQPSDDIIIEYVVTLR